MLTWWGWRIILHRVAFTVHGLLWVIAELRSWHELGSLSAREEELHCISRGDDFRNEEQHTLWYARGGKPFFILRCAWK